CFSGLANSRTNTMAAVPDGVMDKTGGTGAYTMAASSAYATAWYENDPGLTAPQTYFTKYFADLIEKGIPGLPAELRLHQVFTKLRDNLSRDQRPVPDQRSIDAAREFIFARNAAPPDTQSDTQAELQAEPAPRGDGSRGAAAPGAAAGTGPGSRRREAAATRSGRPRGRTRDRRDHRQPGRDPRRATAGGGRARPSASPVQGAPAGPSPEQPASLVKGPAAAPAQGPSASRRKGRRPAPAGARQPPPPANHPAA